jgi:hypothetical protein
MAGEIYPLFGRRAFDFGGLALSGSQAFVLVEALDVGRWTSGLLVVRVIDIDMHVAHQISVTLHAVAPCAEDPTADFVATAPLAEAVVDPSSGILVTDAADLSGAGFVRVRVEGSKAGLGGANVAATLSSELVAKARH